MSTPVPTELFSKNCLKRRLQNEPVVLTALQGTVPDLGVTTTPVDPVVDYVCPRAQPTMLNPTVLTAPCGTVPDFGEETYNIPQFAMPSAYGPLWPTQPNSRPHALRPRGRQTQINLHLLRTSAGDQHSLSTTPTTEYHFRNAHGSTSYRSTPYGLEPLTCCACSTDRTLSITGFRRLFVRSTFGRLHVICKVND
jgi:hypothetical protein